jgi:FkbM family methyltransferase
MNDRMKRWTLAFKTLGPAEVFTFLLRRLMETLRLTRGQYQMKATYAHFPVWCRSHSSDIDVFSQIFVHREYRCLDASMDVGVVIDCGANVGYSSAYFLSKFPNCTVIAVEPDPGNFTVLERNLAPYGNRVRAVPSGVWSETIGLVMDETVFRDGREWARRVRPALADETVAMEAVDIQSLIDSSGSERISILKIDIEGAEYEVFSSPRWRDWIDLVDTVVIEVHSEDAYRATMAAFDEAQFETTWSDELIVARRPRMSAV